MFVESELIFIGSALDVRPRQVVCTRKDGFQDADEKDGEIDACEIMIMEMKMMKGRHRNGLTLTVQCVESESVTVQVILYFEVILCLEYFYVAFFYPM